MNASEILAMAGSSPAAQINLLATNYNSLARLLIETRDVLRKRTAQRDRLLDFLMETADGMRCNAGNFDGGSAATCEHCQIVALVLAIDED